MKHSIRRQISESFIIMLACTIFLSWVMNSLFLENFYTSKKSKSLKIINTYLNTQENLTKDTVVMRIDKLCEDNNVDLLVMDSGLTIKYASMNDPAVMQNVLVDFLFNKNENDNQIQRMTDSRNQSDYFVMWGYLENGDFYVMRTAIQSIIDSVAVANQFMIYIGIMIVLIGSVVTSIISDRISRPLMELTELSDRMIHLDFNAKYTRGGKDEISLLGERMNILSQTLEEKISELRTANNELQRDIKKKEEIDQMRQDFISNVSHELKTPISLIQGYAEGLQECVQDDPESRDFYCEVIMDEASKMNELVKSLLTLTQLEFGNDVITMERVDLTTMLSNILKSAAILAGEKEVKVLFDVSNPVYVWADEFKLEEVLSNYISNAYHHVSGENIIEVCLEEKKVGEEKTIIRVNVFNTGNPIPEEDLDKIWIKFYKVDKARTREYGGSGIGLSIVKAIMDAHQQQCGVENYGNGVRFWFEIEKCITTED